MMCFANYVLSKGKYSISPIFNVCEVLLSASDKAKVFAEIFSCLDD